MRKLSKRQLTAVGAVAAVVILGGGWLIFRPGSSATAATEPTTTAAATLGTMTQAVAATGTIEPAVQSNLSFTSAGVVTALTATVGQQVSAGQSLAIDPTNLQAQVTAAQQTLTAANLSLAAATTSVAQASAQAQITADQTKVQNAQTALAGATLSSPIDGTVATVNLSMGQRVGTSSTSSTGGNGTGNGSTNGGGGSGSGGTGNGASAASTTTSAQIVVISTKSWIVNATVGAAELPSVKTGLQAQITPIGATTKIFGTVQTVGIVASAASGSTPSFPVTIAVTGTPTGLYAGSSATLSVMIKQLQNVLTVPTSAVHTSGSKTVVHETQSDKTVSVPVTVGAVFGAQTQSPRG